MTEEAAQTPEKTSEGAGEKAPSETSGMRTLLGAVLLILVGLLAVGVIFQRGCAQASEWDAVVAQARQRSERQGKLVVLSIYQRLTSYHEREWALIAWACIGRVDEGEGEISVDLSEAEFRRRGNQLTIVLPQPQVDQEAMGLQLEKSQTRVFWKRRGCPDSAVQGLLQETEVALTRRLRSELSELERDEGVMREARRQAETLLFAFYRELLGPEVSFSLEWKSPVADEARRRP